MAAGKKTTIIGRIAIKVIPDTSKFKEETNRQLKRIEKQLDKVKIKVEVDKSDLKRQMHAANREAQRAARNAKIKVDVDSDKVREKLRKVGKDLERVRDVNFEMHGEIIEGEIIDDLRQLSAHVNHYMKANPWDAHLQIGSGEMRTVRGEVIAWMDAHPIRAPLQIEGPPDGKLKRLKRHIEKKLDDIKAKIKATLNAANLKRIAVRLAVLARDRFVKLKPVVDNKYARNAATTLAALTGVRLVGSLSGDFWDFIKNLDKNLPKVLGLTTAFVGLAASIGASASNAFALAASLASIAPLALSLPGIFGGLAIGGLVTILGLKDLNKVLPQIKTKWTALRNEISRDFWSTAKKPIKELADDLFPRLRKSFKPVSKEIGSWFGDFSKQIGISLLPALNGMFDNLKGSIKIFRGATKPLAGIITSLGKMGSKLLPDLAGWAKKILDSFDGWLKKIQGNGTWDRWVADGKAALKDLGRVLKSSVKIFRDIAKAAKDAGGAGLKDLADSMERIQKVTSGAAFQKGMSNFFEGSHLFFETFSGETGGAIGKLFSSLAQTFKDLAPGFGATLGSLVKVIATELAKPETQKAIKDLFGGLFSFLSQIEPYIPNVIDFFRVVASAIGDIAKANGDNVGKMLSSLADLGKVITPEVVKLVEKLTPILADLLDTILEFAKEHPRVTMAGIALAGFFKAIGGGAFLMGAGGGLKGKIGAWLGKSLVSGVKGFITKTPSLVGKLLGGLGGVLGSLIGKGAAWKGAGTFIGSKLLGPIGVALTVADVGKWLMPGIDKIAGWLMTNLPEPIAKAFAGAWLMVNQHPVMKSLRMGSEGILDSLWPDRWPWQDKPVPPPDFGKMQKGLKDAWTGITGAVGVMKNVFQPLVDKFGPLGQTLNEKTNGALGQIATAITAQFNPIMSQGRSIASGLVNTFTSIFGGSKETISTATTSMLSGITGIAKEALTGVPRTAKDELLKTQREMQAQRANLNTATRTTLAGVVPTAKADLGKLPPLAKVAGGQFASGLESKKGAVASAADVLSRAARVANPGLFGAGQTIVSGLISGMRSMVGDVAAVARSIGATIVANKGPIEYDRVMLKPAGEAIVEGLVKALNRGRKDVKSVMQRMSEDIAGTDFAPITPPVIAPGTVGGVSAASLNAASTAYSTAAQPVPAGKTEINIPVKTDADPEDIADALLFGLRRARMGGVYR